MCDVHLVPEVDELRPALRGVRCAECGVGIRRGEVARHIVGVTDDGTERWYSYVAHDICYLLAYSDVGEDGCFRYGHLVPVAAPLRAQAVGCT